MTEIVRAINETIDAARELREHEVALRDAVASGDAQAIVEAAHRYFGGEYAQRRDRAAARIERRPSEA
jgi:hypothetical protein